MYRNWEFCSSKLLLNFPLEPRDGWLILILEIAQISDLTHGAAIPCLPLQHADLLGFRRAATPKKGHPSVPFLMSAEDRAMDFVERKIQSVTAPYLDPK